MSEKNQRGCSYSSSLIKGLGLWGEKLWDKSEPFSSVLEAILCLKAVENEF